MPTRKTVTGRVLAEMFFHKIVCSEGRGTPTLIQPDRGPQMVGFHFQHFHKLCGITLFGRNNPFCYLRFTGSFEPLVQS